MTTLTDFLLARIAEDEAAVMPPADRDRDDCTVVRRARGDKWIAGGCGKCGLGPCKERGPQGAARVLAKCAADRRIVERLTEIASKADDGVTYTWSDTALVDSLRILASVYSDHPDYRDAWRP